MRLATYNIEWFAYLFDKNDRLVLDGKPSGVYGVDRYTQGRAIAHDAACSPRICQAVRCHRLA